jgi:uncharacterized protein YqgV (UPF0045/DUF77 family)
MMLTIEISMYPFVEDYKTPILGFIERLNTVSGLRVSTMATCTLVSGEFDVVMRALGDMLRWSYDTYGKAVYVTKFLPGFTPD